MGVVTVVRQMTETKEMMLVLLVTVTVTAGRIGGAAAGGIVVLIYLFFFNVNLKGLGMMIAVMMLLFDMGVRMVGNQFLMAMGLADCFSDYAFVFFVFVR
jgi:hypothetical protein